MARFKLILEYEGTRYNGWQIQKGVSTVQGEFVTACRNIFEYDNFEFFGAGRTDSGVHALGQVAHLDINTKKSPKNIRTMLNDALPYDINVLHVDEVPERFHARHDAVARSYVYHISKRRTAFGKNFSWWVKEMLNVDLMREAAALFVGRKDYFNFATKTTDDHSTLVEIMSCKLVEREYNLYIQIIGSHFLWNQVRRMVGTLVEVGKQKITLADVKEYFNAPNEFPAQHTAPPTGLYLERVYYQGEKIAKDFKTLINIGS
jgi:tRNA pseudouridine38-40 synthase